MTDSIQHTAGTQNDRGHAILTISIACGALETIAVALRFIARRKLGAGLRSDDWLILLSLAPNYAMIVAGGFCESDRFVVISMGLTLVVGSGLRRQGGQSQIYVDL